MKNTLALQCSKEFLVFLLFPCQTDEISCCGLEHLEHMSRLLLCLFSSPGRLLAQKYVFAYVLHFYNNSKEATNEQKENEDAYDKYALEPAENPHLVLEQYACCVL